MRESSGEIPPCRSLIIASLLFFIICFVIPGPSLAFDLESKIKEFTLKNGLKTLVLERRGSPTFAAHIAFKVGSVDESSGRTGAAHMLEHMLFKGTTTIGALNWEKEKPLLEKVDRIGKKLDSMRRNGADPKSIDTLTAELKQAQAEHKKYIVSESYSRLYSSEGGVGFNAGTSKDMTTYIIRLPSNKLELWAWIESERMRDTVFREYYSEREVVREERKRSYENRAGGKLYERYLAAAFIAHPYGQPIIGWDSDLQTLPLKEMERFYETWYVPNNMVIAIVGSVKFEDAKRVIEKYFSDLPSRPLPDRIVSKEPLQGGERRVDVSFDASSSMLMGFHKPTIPHPDDFVFDVIDSILSSGRASRLYKEVVMKKKVAVSIGTFTAPGSRYPNLFTISAKPRATHTTADVEKAVWEELERLKTEPVTKRDLEKVINNVEADLVRGLVSDYGMARRLTWFEQVAGDWRYITTSVDKIKAVTAEDIQRVARKYFTRDNLTVATLVRKK